MKYEIKFTNQFKRDLKLAKKQNRNLRRYNAAANAGLHNDIFTHTRTNSASFDAAPYCRPSPLSANFTVI